MQTDVTIFDEFATRADKALTWILAEHVGHEICGKHYDPRECFQRMPSELRNEVDALCDYGFILLLQRGKDWTPKTCRKLFRGFKKLSPCQRDCLISSIFNTNLAGVLYILETVIRSTSPEKFLTARTAMLEVSPDKQGGNGDGTP